MPLSPPKKSHYTPRSTSSHLQFLDNTCDSKNDKLCKDAGPSTSSTSSSLTQQDVKSLDDSLCENPPSSMYVTCSTENYCCALLHGLQELHKANIFCDFTITAEGQKISVHRAVMAACSDYFKVMLTAGMTGNDHKVSFEENREDCVDLKGIKYGGLAVVVDFAYSGRLELTTENVKDVLAAASHFQVKVAVELCSKYLKMILSTKNCTDILELAEIYSLVSLHNKAKEFIMYNIEVVSTTEQFNKLNNVQLASMLMDNSLRVPSEYKLFRIVLQWINYKFKERTKYLAELMKNVRLSLLAGNELVEKVSKVDIMRTNSECCKLLTEAKDYHIVISKQPKLQTSRTQVRNNHPSIVMIHSQNVECYTFQNKNHGFLRDSLIPLFNPSIAELDNFMYTCGGKYDGTENNEIATARCFRYDPRFDSWFELTSMNESRKDFVVVPFGGDKLYAIGGQDENMVMCTVECYSVTSEEWEMCASISHSCYAHSGASCQNKIYVSGGQRFSGCANNLSCYCPATNVWEEKASMLHARSNHVMLEVLDKLYVIGGNIEDSYGFPVPIITTECYNPSADQWTVCQTNCNIREAGAATLNNKIYIVGGINAEHCFSDLLQEYDPVKDEMTIRDYFPTRVYGRACCILTLPLYLSGLGVF